MSSTLLKVSRPVYPKPKIAPPAPLLPATPNPEDCFFNFVQALRNIGEFPTHWLNNFRIQASDLSLVRTLRVGGDKGLICVMRTSPRLENFLQENANPLVRVGEPLFDRLGAEFIQRMAHFCLGTALRVAPEIQPGIPRDLQNVEPDVVCKVLVDVTFVEILLYREPLTQR